MKISEANLHRIWFDFNCKAVSYHERVREGVDVLAASEFGRLVENSGILTLLENNQSNDIFRIDGHGLRKKINALLADCGEWFSLHEHSNIERALQIPRTQMEKVNERLERIEKILARIPPAIVEPEPSQNSGAGDFGHGAGGTRSVPLPLPESQRA